MWNAIKVELRETGWLASGVLGLCILSALIGMALAAI